MSDTSTRTGRPSRGTNVWALSTEIFAGIMLATASSFQLLEGIAAVAGDTVFVKGPEYTYAFDITTWGWIHIVLGAVGLAIGIGILTGQNWARVGGVVIAFFGALGAFAFMPYYPGWGIVILAIYVLVIWSLCTQMTDDGRRA